VRMMHAYDYLRIYDQVAPATTLSASDKTTLNAWFNSAGQFYKNMFVKREVVAFVNAPAGDFTLTSDANTACTQNGSVTYIIYSGGPISTQFHDYWNNRNTHDILVAGLAGILTNDTALQADAIRQAKEVLTYGTTADGTPYEFSRAEPTNNEPNLGWRYSAITWALLVELADALARNGNTSLYDWSTTITVSKGGSACVISTTTTKTLKSIVTTHINHADHTLLRYSDGFAGNSNYLIDADNALTGQNSVHYLFSVAGNLYWQDAYIKQMYTLTPGNGPYTPTYPSGDQVSFTSAWSGAGGFAPGILFQMGQLEGVVHPYSLTASGPPTATITQPTSTPTFSTSVAVLTTLAGTATDDVGVTSVTWSCPTCTPTTGTATCASCGAAATSVSWSVGSLTLASGVNVLTVSANDADVQSGTDVLTVTLTPVPVVLQLVK
jgi:hypothetical protein